MTKKMKVMGIATAAVLAISSMAVFAAQTGRIGRGKAKVDLETRLENGEITQEEYDAMKADFEARHEKGDFHDHKGGKLEAMLDAGEITQEVYDALTAEKGPNDEKLDEMLAAGKISQEAYDKIKTRKGDRGASPEEKLAAGEITQEEYDSIKAEFEASGGRKGFHGGRHSKDDFGRDMKKPDSNSETATVE